MILRKSTTSAKWSQAPPVPDPNAALGYGSGFPEGSSTSRTWMSDEWKRCVLLHSKNLRRTICAALRCAALFLPTCGCHAAALSLSAGSSGVSARPKLCKIVPPRGRRSLRMATHYTIHMDTDRGDRLGLGGRKTTCSRFLLRIRTRFDSVRAAGLYTALWWQPLRAVWVWTPRGVFSKARNLLVERRAWNDEMTLDCFTRTFWKHVKGSWRVAFRMMCPWIKGGSWWMFIEDCHVMDDKDPAEQSLRGSSCIKSHFCWLNPHVCWQYLTIF